MGFGKKNTFLITKIGPTCTLKSQQTTKVIAGECPSITFSVFFVSIKIMEIKGVLNKVSDGNKESQLAHASESEY